MATNPFDQFDVQNSNEVNPFDQFDSSSATSSKREQDGALKRGINQAVNAGKTAKALTIGDYDEVSRLTAERDAYRKANPGTKEGNELSVAWEAGDGVMGGVRNVAGELVKDWQEAPSTVDAVRATAKNLSAMGGGIVEQVPNMVMPMAGLLAGGAAGSTAGPAGAVVGGWAGATAGNAAAESPEQVDRSLQEAGIDPQDSAAVKAHLDANGGKITGQALTKGAVIGVVDTATMGAGNQLLKGAAKATRAGALARNVAAAALEPAGEFAGEYLGQGLATGDYDAKGAALEALSSLGQSGITFAGQKIYQYATNPFSRTANNDGAEVGRNPTAETPEVPVLALPSPTYTGTPSDQLLQQQAEQQAQIDAADANASAIYDARAEYEAAQRELNAIRLTTDPEPIQQRLDAMLGIDQAHISERERAAYEKAWDAALNEPVGITHDENGHERPLSMHEYLQAQQQASDKGRQLEAAGTVSPAGKTALDRLAQVADEETTQAVDIPEIPVIGPLSAAANHAVRTGVSAQLQQAATPNVAPMVDTTRQQTIEANRARLEQARAKRKARSAAVGTPQTVMPGTVPIDNKEPSVAEQRLADSTAEFSSESSLDPAMGTAAVPVAAGDETIRAMPKGQARMIASRMTKQGFPSESYPHPTQPGLFAVRKALAQEDAAQTVSPGYVPEAVSVPESRRRLLQATVDNGARIDVVDGEESIVSKEGRVIPRGKIAPHEFDMLSGMIAAREARNTKESRSERQHLPEQTGYSSHTVPTEAAHAGSGLPNAQPAGTTPNEAKPEVAREAAKVAPTESEHTGSNPQTDGRPQKIDDFGEKLEGARKDYAAAYADKAKAAESLDFCRTAVEIVAGTGLSEADR